MTKNLPPLNALRAFEAAARHSSFSKAGDELNVVHTSVARHVRNLEEWLGIKLFFRSGRSIYLTEEGRRFFKDVEVIFKSIESATVRAMPSPQKKVKLSVEPVIMHQWFGKRFYSLEWMSRLNGIDIEVESTFALAEMERAEADLAIRHVLQAPNDPECTTLNYQVIYPFVAPRTMHGVEVGSAVEFLLEQRLVYAHRIDSWELWFRKAGYTGSKPLNLVRQMDPSIALLAAYSGSNAILLPENLTRDAVADGLLVKASDVGLEYGSYVLLTAPGSKERPEVKHTREVLLELLAELPD